MRRATHLMGSVALKPVAIAAQEAAKRVEERSGYVMYDGKFYDYKTVR